MTNHEIALRFARIADILEIQGENAFKVRAYRKAAETIAEMDESLADVEARGALGDIPGFGPAILGKTRDFLTKGTTKLWDEVKDAFPLGVVRMAAVPGIGPTTVRTLWKELGVGSVEELEAAAKEGRVRGVPGFGPAKEKNLLEAIERWRRLSERAPLYVALPYAERLVRALRARPEVVHADAAGSLRRGRDTVGDIDVVVATTDPGATSDAVAALPGITEVFEKGDRKVSAVNDLGLRTDFRFGAPDDYGALLLHFSSGREHNVRLREYAEERGLKINEYGVWDVKTGDEKYQGAEEAGVYGALGLPWIPPELREGRDEIELAAAGRLPELVTLEQFRGQLHEHSTWSDGSASIRDMVEAALARGWDYVAITDHSPLVTVANGLSRERILKQWEEIEVLRPEYEGRIAILKGLEVDIRADGTLDMDDEILAEMDVVVASAHMRYKEDEAKMTARIVRALESPHVDI
ncbi:MAG TPA: PHP domain-containing protein, partial [Armatimonadaceae bacterium]|nr:PHP domain-containing protein [Armatimonadaceae bacterium]